jgi:uncharacterized protein YacL
MVVVNGARQHIGRSVDVEISSVLPTGAGKMAFARLREDGGAYPRD